jgi:hypothetical protein
MLHRPNQVAQQTRPGEAGESSERVERQHATNLFSLVTKENPGVRASL